MEIGLNLISLKIGGKMKYGIFIIVFLGITFAFAIVNHELVHQDISEYYGCESKLGVDFIKMEASATAFNCTLNGKVLNEADTYHLQNEITHYSNAPFIFLLSIIASSVMAIALQKRT